MVISLGRTRFASGAMITSPGWQVAMKAYKLASAPEPTRTSAYRASKTSALSSAAMISICSMASSPVSYCPPDTRAMRHPLAGRQDRTHWRPPDE